MLGEQIGVGGVCGCVVSIRYQEDIVAVWNKDATDEESKGKIRDIMRKVLELPRGTLLEYKAHNLSLQDNSSFRNTNVYRPPGMRGKNKGAYSPNKYRGRGRGRGRGGGSPNKYYNNNYHNHNNKQHNNHNPNNPNNKNNNKANQNNPNNKNKNNKSNVKAAPPSRLNAWTQPNSKIFKN